MPEKEGIVFLLFVGKNSIPPVIQNDYFHIR